MATTDKNWVNKILSGEIKPDLVIEPDLIYWTDPRVTDEDSRHDGVNLTSVGATIYSVGSLARIPITQAGPELAYDLARTGCCTADQWRERIEGIYKESKATVHPGDIGYPIFAADTVIVGSKRVTVWFEQFSGDAASIYYPHER
jgi:hypothetical protein